VLESRSTKKNTSLTPGGTESVMKGEVGLS